MIRHIAVAVACYLVGKLISDTYLAGWIAHFTAGVLLVLTEESK